MSELPQNVPPSAEGSRQSASNATPIMVSEDAQPLYSRTARPETTGVQERPNFLTSPRTPPPTDICVDRDQREHQNNVPTQVVVHANTFEPPEPPETPFTPTISKSLTTRLFLSHFLSTWNSRMFEMGAVLFIATIFPGTLRPMSIYALVRSGAAIVLSPAIGSWIDTGDRLNVIRVSIIGQRLAVAASCGIFWQLHERKALENNLKTGLFAVTIVLACVEKLCSIMNLVSLERDWVVVITRDNEVARRLLNARMRRIDLFCKLLGPLVISLVNGTSTTVAIWITLGMNCSSVLVEYFTIATVYKKIPALRRTATRDAEDGIQLRTPRDEFNRLTVRRKMIKNLQPIAARLLPLKSLPFYLRHPAFLPSISLSLLYFTVLSFSGQMITFLLAVGYTSSYVGIVRAISTIFELSATWVAPKVQRHIGAVRGGIWFLTWQMTWLAAGLTWFFAGGESSGMQNVFAASGLVGGVILSRVGLWGFDLCAQSVVQEEVDEDNRGAFSTVEASFQNLFELLSYASTIVFSKPTQFQWPVVISVGAVYAAGGIYAVFVRRRRGHLVHTPSCIKPRLDRPQ